MRRYVIPGIATAIATVALSACATGYKPAVVHDIGAMKAERI